MQTGVWINHNGGEMPVPAGTMVRVCIKTGEGPKFFAPAESYNWVEGGWDGLFLVTKYMLEELPVGEVPSDIPREFWVIGGLCYESYEEALADSEDLSYEIIHVREVK